MRISIECVIIQWEEWMCHCVVYFRYHSCYRSRRITINESDKIMKLHFIRWSLAYTSLHKISLIRGIPRLNKKAQKTEEKNKNIHVFNTQTYINGLIAKLPHAMREISFVSFSSFHLPRCYCTFVLACYILFILYAVNLMKVGCKVTQKMRNVWNTSVDICLPSSARYSQST